MLIVTRKPKETIHIGNGVVITILSSKQNRCRVGIEAPTEVKVLRGELVQSERSGEGDAVAK